MNPSLFDTCKSYLLAQQSPHPHHHRRTLRAVTISREAGAGAVTVGRLVAGYLQAREKEEPASPWAVLDKNLVEKVLEDHGLNKSVAQYMPEDVVSSIQDTVEDLLGVHPSSWNLVQHTSSTILKLSMMGNVVLIGRGANLITAHLKHVFHVRLVAPLEQRIRHVEDYYKMGHAAAAQYVTRTDRARVRYIRQHFKSSVADPLAYHLTINTGCVDFGEAARIIGDAVSNMPRAS